MRRILFAPETFNFAEVTRGIEVARRLRDGGHAECVFMGYSHRYADAVTDAGFELRMLEPELTDREAEQMLAVDQGRGVRHPFTTQMLATRVANERALIQELGADAVVIGTTLSQLISARAERVPLVYVKPLAYSLPHIGALRTTGMIPTGHAAGRAADRTVAAAVRAIAPRLRYVPGPFRKVARTNGVTLPRATLSLLDADLNLVTTAPSLLPPEVTLPDGYEAVGPIFARLDGEVPPLVAELAARPEPLVYVAMGSSGTRELLLTLLRRLGRVRAQFLAPVAALLEPDDVRSLPPNVHVMGWLPADRLGDAVDMAITHGGEGTVQTSVTQGWPFVGIPLQMEQRFNVQQWVDAGTARLVPPRRVGRTDWAETVESVLADAGMRSAAARMANVLGAVDGAGNAAAAIVRYLDGRGRAGLRH